MVERCRRANSWCSGRCRSADAAPEPQQLPAPLGRRGGAVQPGEVTQRQLLLAGVPASAITRMCITHFHGDHCLGLPAVLQRRSLDRCLRAVDVYFPAAGLGECWTRRRVVPDQPTCANPSSVVGGTRRLRMARTRARARGLTASRAGRKLLDYDRATDAVVRVPAQ